MADSNQCIRRHGFVKTFSQFVDVNLDVNFAGAYFSIKQIFPAGYTNVLLGIFTLTILTTPFFPEYVFRTRARV